MTRLRSAALGLILGMLVPGMLAAQQQQGLRTTQQGIILNFQDVDLAYVISALAQAARLNVTYFDLPEKQITLRTSDPVSADEIAGLIRDLAAANGISVTEQNGFMRLQGTGGNQLAEPRLLFIHRLQHARAQVLSQTLQALFGGVIRASSPAEAATLSQQLRMMEQQSAMMRAQMQAQQQGQEFAVTVRGELEGNVTIVPDEVTNSLLVRATAADWTIIQQAIQSLDQRPLQVVIEVVIAEVRRTDEVNVGVSFLAEKGDPEGRSTTGSFGDEPAEGQFSLRIVRTGDVDVEATLSALARTGDVTILSRPVILAQNNQEANILVGSQRPFVQVSRSLPTDQVSFDQVVQYQSVGTSLTILPTINDDGYANLALAQEVSSATEEVQFGAPVISTREATTQLLARNGQTVVVGGLIDRQKDRLRTGIPFLKDIPILGFLFGTTREFEGNSELFLFLTPYIVATDQEAEQLRQEIENRVELLNSIVPIRPMLPPVVRTLPDTIGGGR